MQFWRRGIFGCKVNRQPCQGLKCTGASAAKSTMFTRGTTYLEGAASEPIREGRAESSGRCIRLCCQCQIKTKLARFVFAAPQGSDGTNRPPTTETSTKLAPVTSWCIDTIKQEISNETIAPFDHISYACGVLLSVLRRAATAHPAR